MREASCRSGHVPIARADETRSSRQLPLESLIFCHKQRLTTSNTSQVAGLRMAISLAKNQKRLCRKGFSNPAECFRCAPQTGKSRTARACMERAIYAVRLAVGVLLSVEEWSRQ
jgi:hypothetical protein